MQLKKLTILILMMLNFQAYSQSVMQKKIVCIDREVAIKILNDLKEGDIAKEQVVIYDNVLQTQKTQLAVMDSVMSLSAQRIKELSDMLSDAEGVIDQQRIQHDKLLLKAKRKRTWNNIAFGILTGILIITTTNK